MAVRALALLALLAGIASAQPGAPEPPPPPQPGVLSQAPPPEYQPAPQTPSESLRLGNDAATAGDWAAVSRLVDPLLQTQLQPGDLAEAQRLAGLAAFFQDRAQAAEAHFLAYLRIDLDGYLDPALYPPEALTFFNEVKAKHNAELRARRPKPKRYAIVSIVPVASQLQNEETVKGVVIAGVLIAFLATNLTTYGLLRTWCTTDQTCDSNGDHYESAQTAQVINVAAAIGLGVTVVYGVYDGVKGYRRVSRERAQPFVSSTGDNAFIGVAGRF